MNTSDPHIKSFLIFGSGSAGRRHALTLRELFPSSLIQIVKRSPSLQPTQQLIDADIHIISDPQSALLQRPQLVVVASPATFHRDDVLLALPHCQKVLIEKPLSHNLASASLLLQALQRSPASIHIGYHLRFSETPLALLALSSDTNLGSLQSASFGYGQHLSLWRANVDPSQSVTARADLGGGVLLEWSHEIDAIDMLVGTIASVNSAEIVADSAIADGLVDTKVDVKMTSTSGVDLSLHLNMHDETPWRTWRLNFRNASLEANLLSGEIHRIDHKNSKTKIFQASKDERGNAAKSQTMSFLSSDMASSNLAQGHSVMKTIDAIRSAAETKQSIMIAAHYGSM
jgi:hypothetical protein